MQSIKEHNLKANHNITIGGSGANGSVCNLSKNTIWKQITTTTKDWNANHCLYAIYQRTQSESKSQLFIGILVALVSVCNLSKNTIWKQITTIVSANDAYYFCMQSIKEHNLKANHNYPRAYHRNRKSVCNLSKNTIWKQITTNGTGCKHGHALYAIYQRTQSESKSQRERAERCRRVLCMQSIKEHNLKANHNSTAVLISPSFSVCNLSKNTIWKQITTTRYSQVKVVTLYAIYQRTQSESKSQLWPWNKTHGDICMQSIKEHNLKANHNTSVNTAFR